MIETIPSTAPTLLELKARGKSLDASDFGKNPGLAAELRAVLAHCSQTGSYTSLTEHGQWICSRLKESPALALNFLPEISGLLTSPEWWFRVNAAMILSGCGAASRPLLHQTIKFARDAEGEPRCWGAEIETVCAVCAKYPEDIAACKEFLIEAVRAGTANWQIGTKPSQALLKLAQQHGAMMRDFVAELQLVRDSLTGPHAPVEPAMVEIFRTTREKTACALDSTLAILRT